MSVRVFKVDVICLLELKMTKMPFLYAQGKPMVAKRLGLPTLDNKIPGSKPSGDRIQLMTVSSCIATDKRGYPHNIFLISPLKHMLLYPLEAPRRGASNEYPQHMFLWKNKKDISIFRMKKSALSVAGLCHSIAPSLSLSPFHCLDMI